MIGKVWSPLGEVLLQYVPVWGIVEEKLSQYPECENLVPLKVGFSYHQLVTRPEEERGVKEANYSGQGPKVVEEYSGVGELVVPVGISRYDQAQ